MQVITQPFNSGNSQAVRLPKLFAFAPNTPLILQKENDVLTITPVASLGQVPTLFAKLGEHLPDEFVRDEFVDDKRGW